jgi:hypothetical protein
VRRSANSRAALAGGGGTNKARIYCTVSVICDLSVVWEVKFTLH